MLSFIYYMNLILFLSFFTIKTILHIIYLFYLIYIKDFMEIKVQNSYLPLL